MAWTTCTIGDCLSLLSGGTPSKSNSSYWNGDIPWVSCKSIKDIRIYDTEDRVTKEAIGNGTKLVPKGTILFVVRGMILAKEFPVAEAQVPVAFNQDLKAVVPNEHLVDQRFLFYYLLAHRYGIRALADEAAHGTKRIQTDRFLAYPFVYPPLCEQRHIASILSAYDDLIENNTRRIAILEELARRLFDEWFVKFRFSGHEEGENEAELPEGWSIQALETVADVNPESIKPRNAPAEIRYIDIASVSPGKVDAIKFMPFDEAPSRARRVVRSGDILWSCVRPNRRSHVLVLSPEQDTIASTGFAVLRASKVPYSFLYLSVTTDGFVDYLVNHATGAAYPAVKQDDFKGAKLIIPTDEVLKSFESKVDPMFRLIDCLARKNENLRTQRDLLLPKLISGEIDVSQAERQGEEQ